MINAKWPHIDNIAEFSYSKLSHFELFKSLPFQSYNVGDPDPIICDLKVYQDYLINCYIINNLPKGSKILEIGGGDSRILKYFTNDYECWNADKCEGLGNGPVHFTSPYYKIIYDYAGSFNPNIPSNYFDLVFSISALEHTPEDGQIQKNIIEDITRMLKPGGASFHSFDAILKKDGQSWVNGLISTIYKTSGPLTSQTSLETLSKDPNLYSMSKSAYKANWQPITNEDYDTFGRPFSYNIFWLNN